MYSQLKYFAKTHFNFLVERIDFFCCTVLFYRVIHLNVGGCYFTALKSSEIFSILHRRIDVIVIPYNKADMFSCGEVQNEYLN